MPSDNSNFGEEMGETLVEQGGKAVKNVVGGAVGSVKQQVFDNAKGNQDQTQGTSGPSTALGVNEIQEGKAEAGSGKRGQKLDPVTGKPMPSKKMLTQLNQQVAQLAQARIKRVREELEKQRLKVSEPASAKAARGEAGPEVKPEPEKPKEDIVAKMLKGSKSTGEFKGLIGG